MHPGIAIRSAAGASACPVSKCICNQLAVECDFPLYTLGISSSEKGQRRASPEELSRAEHAARWLGSLCPAQRQPPTVPSADREATQAGSERRGGGGRETGGETEGVRPVASSLRELQSHCRAAHRRGTPCSSRSHSRRARRLSSAHKSNRRLGTWQRTCAPTKNSLCTMTAQMSGTLRSLNGGVRTLRPLRADDRSRTWR